MKIRSIFFLFVLFLTSSQLLADIQGSLEVRSACFFHSSHRFKEIYGDVGGSYQVEGAVKINNCFDVWGNVDWFSKHGRSVGLRHKTRVTITNYSFGIKALYQMCHCGLIYVGIGPSFADISIRNKHSNHNKASKCVIGGVLKTGINYFVTENIFLDVFVDYLYQPAHFQNHVDIGGFKTGLGLGYQF